MFPFSLTLKVETEEQVLATFCGRETTDTEQTPGQEVVLSPGSFMSITFRSDFSNEERFTGFEAHYMAVGKLEKWVAHPWVSLSLSRLKVPCALFFRMNTLYSPHRFYQ